MAPKTPRMTNETDLIRPTLIRQPQLQLMEQVPLPMRMDRLHLPRARTVPPVQLFRCTLQLPVASPSIDHLHRRQTILFRCNPSDLVVDLESFEPLTSPWRQRQITKT